MKTTLFFGAFAIVLLASCETEINHMIPLDGEDPGFAFSAITETGGITKTHLSDNASGAGYYSLYWTKGDDISVYDGTSTSVFTTDSDGESTGMFTWKEGTIDKNASVYMAFYPSSITISDMTLPETQDYVADNVADFPMYAGSRTTELRFKNLCGIIRLSLRNKEIGSLRISRIDLSAPHQGMSGHFSIGDEGAAIVTGAKGVSLNCETPVPIYTSTETDFNIVVPQDDYDPLYVTITDAEGKKVDLESEGKVRVTRSGITRISLLLSSSSFSFDSSLERIPITDTDVDFTDR